MNAAVGAVIVTFNSEAVIGRCLRSLRGVAEIVIVDNASEDATCDAIARSAPRALLIRNQSNRGFAAAVNQGVAALRTPLVLLLNPDIELEGELSEASPIVRDSLDRKVGLVGGQLLDHRGRFQHGFAVRSFPTAWTLAAEALLLNHLWPSNPWNRRYRRLDFDPSKPQKCEQPAGALWMLRREVFDAIGGMDEGFFPLWFEDVDFCLRLHRAGYEIRYQPGCAARHEGAHSLHAMSLQARQKAWYGSLLRFADKHFSAIAAGLLRPSIALGLAVRGLSCMLGAGSREQGRGAL